jgi:molybdate transport system substrate-binding protein
VGQSFQYAASGNTDAAFVALSQVKALGEGSYWEVPADRYSAIRQQAVWLKRAQARPEAGAFLDWLRSARVAEVIREFGYGVEDGHDT